MKTAKLFVHGSEYCDLNYPVESDIRAAIDNELSNMETLDHIPQRMRYTYESYRNALAQGHAYACRYMIDGQMND